MVRKIFKSGNSLVVSLPGDALERLGLEEGSKVNVAVNERAGRIVIERARAPLTDVGAAFARQLDDFIERYRPALEALAECPFSSDGP